MSCSFCGGDSAPAVVWGFSSLAKVSPVTANLLRIEGDADLPVLTAPDSDELSLCVRYFAGGVCRSSIGAYLYGPYVVSEGTGVSRPRVAYFALSSAGEDAASFDSRACNTSCVSSTFSGVVSDCFGVSVGCS